MFFVLLFKQPCLNVTVTNSNQMTSTGTPKIWFLRLTNKRNIRTILRGGAQWGNSKKVLQWIYCDLKISRQLNLFNCVAIHFAMCTASFGYTFVLFGLLTKVQYSLLRIILEKIKPNYFPDFLTYICMSYTFVISF